MHAEHFGISVVEAMSCDAVPVVYRDGGVWEDIVERGKFGYGYTTIEEAVEAVELALDDYKTAEQTPTKAQRFSDRNLREKVARLLGV